MAGDNESKLDQVLLALGQMAGRCDSIDRRIDAMKKSDAGDKSLTEGGEFPGDIATAKRLAADTARYTKYGSNCNPGFADSVSVDPVQAMNLEAQELRAKLRKVEQAQKNLFQNMRPLSAEEESEMREFQARADSVYAATGDADVRCPAPMSYERPHLYMSRILSDLSRHSGGDWGNKDTEDLALLPPSVLRIAADDILSGATAAFKRGDHWPKDILVPHTNIDPIDGHRVTTFTGPIFTRQFQNPRRTMRICKPAEIWADHYR